VNGDVLAPKTSTRLLKNAGASGRPLKSGLRVSCALNFGSFASIFLSCSLAGQTLSLPPRPTNAPAGTEFAQSVASLDQLTREERIYEQVADGNVPEFLRTLVPVTLTSANGGKTNTATYLVTPDYLAVGSDDDYFLTPLSPVTAQRIANLLGCTLPTRKMVDDIYSAATVKLTPSPIPPSPSMATVPVFLQHNSTLREQRREQIAAHPLGALVAGDKKDVVITKKLLTSPGKVAIYGWHKPDGKPIQPLYTGHADYYADYSHGIRLVQLRMTVNGEPRTIPEVLADANLAPLLSDEGPMENIRYPLNSQSNPKRPESRAITLNTNPLITLADFRAAPFNERTVTYNLDPDIRVHINAPSELVPARSLKLVIYALPNGNTIEQTIGKAVGTNDWHYDIQHIGAQTRFVRNELKDCNLVVAYLEARGKSWPAWRKQHSDIPNRIPDVIDSIKAIFSPSSTNLQLTLTGHSGGGSFIFGYLNAVERIPDDIERIAFLDGNYAYDGAQGHEKKLAKWLLDSDRHRLIVLAYNDAVALLNGTNFVSAAGGTWGRSHKMIEDLGQDLVFASQTNADFETSSALDGRVCFLLKENPEKRIFHTVQVERNGFIHCLLLGTAAENKRYVYFGPRAYTQLVQAD
jgi:hypothetical protein